MKGTGPDRMRVLVTGATGLVGNNVVRQLLERGDDVRVLVRDPSDRALASLRIDVRQGGIEDRLGLTGEVHHLNQRGGGQVGEAVEVLVPEVAKAMGMDTFYEAAKVS